MCVSLYAHSSASLHITLEFLESTATDCNGYPTCIDLDVWGGSSELKSPCLQLLYIQQVEAARETGHGREKKYGPAGSMHRDGGWRGWGGGVRGERERRVERKAARRNA